MTAATLDRVVVLLIEARDHLYEEIDHLDDEEINARTHLDTILGRRAQRHAALIDLEQLITTHHTGTTPATTPSFEPSSNETPAAVAPSQPAATNVAPSTPTPRPGGTRGRKPAFDYTLIAEWILNAEAAGTYTTDALGKHFGVPRSTAKNWRSRCLSLGLLNGATTPAEPPPPVEEVPLEEIAATYLEAVAADRKPIQTLVDLYDIDRATANEWLALCREHGLLPPRDQPQIPADAPMKIRKHVNTGASAL